MFSLMKSFISTQKEPGILLVMREYIIKDKDASTLIKQRAKINSQMYYHFD